MSLDTTPKSATETRWAVILAGGDGTRLHSVTRRVAGDDRPKQFCRLLGETTLLEQAQARAALVAPPERTVFVLSKAHERFYRPILADVCADRLVVQDGNRGTAPAILYSLLRVTRSAPDARVVLLPSDHYVSDDAAFMNHVDAAFRALARWPKLTILLGIVPDRPEVQYGWIELAETLSESPALSRIGRFWEKPEPRVALAVWARGALWNSFVIVARADSLLARFERVAPALYRAFNEGRRALGTPGESEVCRRLYSGVAAMDFSRGVLAAHRDDLAVLTVNGVGWSDVGDPERLLEIVKGRAPGKAEAFA